jgi:hypothetical protein
MEKIYESDIELVIEGLRFLGELNGVPALGAFSELNTDELGPGEALWLVREQIMEYLKQHTQEPNHEAKLAKTAAKIVPGSSYASLIKENPNVLNLLPNKIVKVLRNKLEIPIPVAKSLETIISHHKYVPYLRSMNPFSTNNALTSLCEWMGEYRSNGLLEQINTLVEKGDWQKKRQVIAQIEGMVLEKYLAVAASEGFPVSLKGDIGCFVKPPLFINRILMEK